MLTYGRRVAMGGGTDVAIASAGVSSDLAGLVRATARTCLRSPISLYPAKLLRVAAKTDFRRVDVSL